MNLLWKAFLNKQNAIILDNDEIKFSHSTQQLSPSLYPISQLALLSVTGKDASSFLQGQLTCDVNKLQPDNSFFAAFCNAKGRVISTLLIIQQVDGFLLILPRCLVDKVQKKLQMYVMRSKVTLKNISTERCLIGISGKPEQLPLVAFPEDNFSHQTNLIKLPNSRYLMIETVDKTIDFWLTGIEKGLNFQDSTRWNYLDIRSGLAWLKKETSERYIPQMLNLDALGGISFDKGCYTGQEVVARTHYLGKAKRKLMITKSADEAKTGDIIQSSTYEGEHYFLVVLRLTDKNA
jgi:folate-binding protein YgfZ